MALLLVGAAKVDLASPDNEEDADHLDRLAEQETAHFLRRSSLTYLECCVSLMLTHMAKEDVAALLEREAELLREFD